MARDEIWPQIAKEKKKTLVECVKHSYRPQIGGMGGVALYLKLV